MAHSLLIKLYAFVHMCGQMTGMQVDGNDLSTRAKKLLDQAPNMYSLPDDQWELVSNPPPNPDWEAADKFVLAYSETHDFGGTQFAIVPAADFYLVDAECNESDGNDIHKFTHWRPLKPPKLENIPAELST